MAKVANAFTTYQAQANREDLSDKIYNIDPFDTPVVSMAGRRTVKNRTFDWQTENLPVVDLNNAREEGFELQNRAGVPTVRRSNVCQISSRDATVSGSQEASDAAGKNSGDGPPDGHAVEGSEKRHRGHHLLAPAAQRRRRCHPDGTPHGIDPAPDCPGL
jgi:hypothetical protein